jgi:hypothetical protein
MIQLSRLRTLAKNTPTFLVSLFFLLVFNLQSLQSTAQDSMHLYSVTYIKLKDPSYASQYESLLKYYGKKVAEYELESKKITGYYALQVIVPSGSGNEYDYEVVVNSDDINVLLDDSTPFLKNAFPGMTDEIVKSVADQFNKVRKIVKTEIYSNVDAIPPTSEPKYVEVDYMKPASGKYSDYLKSETTTWKPVHKERIKLGALSGWSIDAKVLPIGEKEDYDIVTVNFFNSLPMMMEGKYEEAFKTVWPKLNIDKVGTDISNLRTIVKSNLLKPVVAVDAGTMKK